MKIALIGYGKMGKTIDRLAAAQGHTVVGRMNTTNQGQWAILEEADVAIEFTNPHAAVDNILACINHDCPVVTGSTGWYKNLPRVQQEVTAHNGSLLYASNFSIGVNLFMAVNQYLAWLMNSQAQYDVSLSETHHTAKLDAPSGTAITLAEDILKVLDRKKSWVNSREQEKNQLSIISHREADVPGTHSIVYSSEIDDIRLEHRAHNRDGFALGALTAAQWVTGRKGVFTMNDVLNLNQGK